MESEMQRAGRRALQAKGTAGAKALRQDSTGQTRQNSKGSWSWWGGRRGRRQGDRGWQGSDQQRLLDVAFMPGVLQDFKQRGGLTRGIFQKDPSSYAV